MRLELELEYSGFGYADGPGDLLYYVSSHVDITCIIRCLGCTECWIPNGNDTMLLRASNCACLLQGEDPQHPFPKSPRAAWFEGIRVKLLPCCVDMWACLSFENVA